jgi:aconitate hydratase 2 / 2-methylisocitrate dehydratase
MFLSTKMTDNFPTTFFKRFQMLAAYRQHAVDRANLGIPPLPLDANQTQALCDLLQGDLLQQPAATAELYNLLRDRVPPGVDPAAYVKATFLTAIIKGSVTSPLISPLQAIELLGTMLGGYNVQALIDTLQLENL